MSPPHKRYDLFDFYDDDSISDSSIIKLKPQLEPKAFVPPQEIVEEYMKQATVISPKIKESPRVAPIKGICPMYAGTAISALSRSRKGNPVLIVGV